MDDLLREFLAESAENLLAAEQGLVDLEREPEDGESLAAVFRAVHTIKGTCGFLGLARLEAVAHAAEDVLDALRSGGLSVSQEVVSDVLAATDVMGGILSGLEAAGSEPEGDDHDLIARLRKWLENAGDVDAELAEMDRLFREAQAAARRAAEAGPAEDAVTGGGAVPEAPPAACGGGGAAGPGGAAGAGAQGSHTVRVSVELLDRLMNLAGELVLARNQLVDVARAGGVQELTLPLQHLRRLTSDLHEAVTRTRMQPIGNAWRKLPRLVRELARPAGKEVDLVLSGADTELDRQILQGLADPLTHLVRNSVDHGLETPDERREAGKPPRGRIELEAFQEGGHIVVEVRDDGRGLDVERIRAKAVEKGLATTEEVAGMPEHRVLEFVFEPGFSTAATVTSVSGRGVGMDVVRRNIEGIGGTVQLSTRTGEGTAVRVRVPLTLAIMPALIVELAGQAFAVAQLGVQEVVRIGDSGREGVVRVKDASFLDLRSQLVPLVRLDRVLALDERPEVAAVVICQVGTVRFGLVVDRVVDTVEIVVKPRTRAVAGLDVYAGTSILGDGRVIMILDLPGVARTAGVMTRGEEQGVPEGVEAGRETPARGMPLLLVDVADSAPRAVPLSQVSRLEEIPAADLSFADGRWMAQYRGGLLPVVPADERMDVLARDPRPVIVFSDGEQAAGLAVDGIEDIVEEAFAVAHPSDTPGILGTARVAGRTTEILDAEYWIAAARPGAGTEGGDRLAGGADERRRVLLVDDSPFFLNMLGPVLRAEGFDVAVSHDGAHALTRLRRGERFHVVVSDIDMPHMDGFELARSVRAGGWEDLPLLALTSRGSDRDRERGRSAGFDRYLTKFDAAEVVEAVREAAGRDGPPRRRAAS